MELMTSVQPRLFSTLTPSKIVELFKLGDVKPPKPGIRTAEIVEGFYSFLGFTRLTASTVIRKAIVRGVQEATFGYVAATAPEIGTDGRYQVLLTKVRFATGVAEDEIDLESGFVMMPQAMPQPAPAPAAPAVQEPLTGYVTGQAVGATPTTSEPGVSTPRPPSGQPQTLVEIAFAADRNQLFTAWNALANLADLAGKVAVTVRAESEKGFDRSKLQNGVIEPLKEADLIQ
jgi:hypothetical protein